MSRRNRMIVAGAVVLNVTALGVLFWMEMDTRSHTERRAEAVQVQTNIGAYRTVNAATATAMAERSLADMKSYINSQRLRELFR